MAPANEQSLGNRVRERAKLAVRGVLHKVDLELSRDPYTHRLARTLDTFEIDTVLDVGANVGQFALMVRRAGYAGRIISCEPLSGAYGQLSARAARDDRWTTVRSAVGREPGSTTINVAANSYSSSVRSMTDAHLSNAPGSEYIGTETVDVTTVRDLVKEHSVVPSRSLLKIDTQGFEDEVLAGAGDHVDEFAAIQLELSMVELYEGQSLFEDHYAFMRDHGFRLHILEPGFAGKDGQMLQCDGLFVRG